MKAVLIEKCTHSKYYSISQQK